MPTRGRGNVSLFAIFAPASISGYMSVKFRDPLTQRLVQNTTSAWRYGFFSAVGEGFVGHGRGKVNKGEIPHSSSSTAAALRRHGGSADATRVIAQVEHRGGAAVGFGAAAVAVGGEANDHATNAPVFSCSLSATRTENNAHCGDLACAISLFPS